MVPAELIRILADGRFHSGESLGLALGVTRAAVWKRIQSLGDLGLDVESSKGQGYRIKGGLSLLDAELISSQLTADTRDLLSILNCYIEVDSTNQYLLSSNAGCGDVCLAERQTVGRGRRGRSWVSPFGQNIYLSMRWHYEQGVAALEGLSLAVGVLLVELLVEEYGVKDLLLKWPNDLLYCGRKLGGILVEVGGDLTGDCAVVVGIGLNVSMSQWASSSIDQSWADLAQAGVPVDRNQLCSRILSRLLPELRAYPQKSFREYRDRWLVYAAFLGQGIVLATPSGAVEGLLRGVDNGGGLIVEVDRQEKVFSGGEISLRSA